MRAVSYEQICAMKGNGASMRHVLKYFIDKGAVIYLLHESTGKATSRFFVVEYENSTIPLRAYKRNFYSVYNSALGQAITSDKLKSHALLEAWNVPTPFTTSFDESFDHEKFLATYKTAVVKPAAIAAHGDGITLGVNDSVAFTTAVETAQAINPNVMIQQQVTGDDHRLLFVDYKFVAAVKRIPATVQGDGTHTIKELIDQWNDTISYLWQQIRSGDIDADSVKGSTSKIPIDEVVSARGSDFLSHIPEKDTDVRLLDKSNVSLGGQTYDVTDSVNQELANQIGKMLEVIGLPLCGVDVLSEDISSSPEDKKSYVIELNAAPGLRLHELPYKGQPRSVCALVAESLIDHYKTTIDQPVC